MCIATVQGAHKVKSMDANGTIRSHAALIACLCLLGLWFLLGWSPSAAKPLYPQAGSCLGILGRHQHADLLVMRRRELLPSVWDSAYDEFAAADADVRAIRAALEQQRHNPCSRTLLPARFKEKTFGITLQSLATAVLYSLRSNANVSVLTPPFRTFGAGCPERNAPTTLACFLQPLSSICKASAADAAFMAARVNVDLRAAPRVGPQGSRLPQPKTFVTPPTFPEQSSAVRKNRRQTAASPTEYSEPPFSADIAPADASFHRVYDMHDRLSPLALKSEFALRGVRVLPQSWRHRGLFFAVSHTLAHMLRPSRSAAKALANAKLALRLNDAETPVLAVHVKHAAPCAPHLAWGRKRTCDPLKTYLNNARAMVLRYGYRSVLLLTDEPHVAREAKALGSVAGAALLVRQVRPTPSRVKKAKAKQRRNASVAEAEAAEARARAVEFVVSVLLLAGCQGFVGKFSTHLSRIAYALMSATQRSGDCLQPFVSLDAPWCFGLNCDLTKWIPETLSDADFQNFEGLGELAAVVSGHMLRLKPRNQNFVTDTAATATAASVDAITTTPVATAFATAGGVGQIAKPSAARALAKAVVAAHWQPAPVRSNA